MVRATLEIYDTTTGEIETVLTEDRRIEAPNWMPDGKTLLVNCAGGLYRVALDNPELVRVNTVFCNLLNDDHGPSPDGSMIAICDKVESKKACIYVIPAEGGQPRKVTENVPSWFHSWSPDGKHVFYAAVRDDKFAIATCPVEGGEEKVLITGPGHYDGPDLSPDGKWIWFNATRNGHMEIFRMHLDGSNVEQMTKDAWVDWFPHPSPDGTQVVYLSYPPGTEGHPFAVDVELRSIPIEGGEPKTLVKLCGGQGTINAPNWSPDGKRFAYVRYTLKNPQSKPKADDRTQL